MEKEESKTDIINDKVEKEIISKNIIITKINNNSSKIYNNHLFKFTEKLYNSDEHLVKTNLLKKKNSSRDNLLNLNFMKKKEKDKNSIYKSSSRMDIPKIYRKSLFSDNKNLEDNSFNLSKHIKQKEPILISKKSNN